MNDIIIETNNLTKQYNGKAGCNNITLSVPHGIVYGFLGPNGAGKSTFVRTMLGLLRPTSGSATMLGAPIGSVQSRKKVGYLPELFRYPDWLTGNQLLAAHADLCGIPYREQRCLIERLIDRVGLTGRSKEKIRGYSKGMQQRIGLACALLNDPELIFLDEPTSALDPIGRKDVRDLINELRSQGKTVFLNSHLLNEVESVCDHVAIINKSELIVQGEWRELSDVETKVEITIEGDPIHLWQEAPRFVKAVERVSQASGRSRWLVSLDAETNIPHLIEALTSQRFSIYGVTPKEQHLEDVFLHWVNKKGGSAHVDNR